MNQNPTRPMCLVGTKKPPISRRPIPNCHLLLRPEIPHPTDRQPPTPIPRNQDRRVKHPSLRHLLHPFFCAARFTEYAIATACFCGFPAAISLRMFSDTAFLLPDFTNGITPPCSPRSLWRSPLPRPPIPPTTPHTPPPQIPYPHQKKGTPIPRVRQRGGGQTVTPRSYDRIR